MSISVEQQVYNNLTSSKSILITFKKHWDLDSLATSLALALWLNKLNKQIDIVCEDFSPQQQHNFLKDIKKIQTEIVGLKKFTLALNLNKTKLNEFSYEVKDNKLLIYLVPQKGMFDKKDISTTSSDYKYNLIVTINTPDLESLESIYQINSDFFYNTPIINIGHSPENEQFGQINYFNLTATSAAEMIFNIIEKHEPHQLDETIATYLLTGMIAKTKSFKTSNVTPVALETASKLIGYGADRELIIRNLYNTKSLETLKLWGKILARLKNDNNYKLVWSYLKSEDLKNIDHNQLNTFSLIDELITSSPEAEIIVLFSELAENETEVIIYSTKNLDSRQLVENFQATGNKSMANFKLSDSVQTTAKKVLDNIKDFLQKHY